MHRGFTLMQLLVVLGVMSLLSALALPRINGAVNTIAVRGAAADVTGAFALARTVALTRSVYAAVHVDSARQSVTVATGADTLLVRLVGDAHGVKIRSNRDSMSYDPMGHGYGAANQSIVIARGSAMDTVVISRLGRVRYRG